LTPIGSDGRDLPQSYRRGTAAGNPTLRAARDLRRETDRELQGVTPNQQAHIEDEPAHDPEQLLHATRGSALRPGARGLGTRDATPRYSTHRMLVGRHSSRLASVAERLRLYA